MIRAGAAAVLIVIASATSASAVDLRDLLACKAAAARMCDRSGGLTRAALSRCGATLASRSSEVGPKCVAVLQRYGQLSVVSAQNQGH